MKTLSISMAALVVLSAGEALAAGIAVQEVSSQASGRGGAAAAVSMPASVYYNPAAITRLSGLQVDVGATVLMPRWKYNPAGDAAGEKARSKNTPSTPPNVSVTYGIGDIGIGDLSAGLGFYVPYGSSFSWPADWSLNTSVQDISMQVYELNPVLALRVHDKVAIGAGFRYMPGNVYMKQAVAFGDQSQGSVEIAGSGNALGANAGISVWPTDGLSLAFSWRSPSTLRLSGTSNFDFPAPFDVEANDRNVETKLHLAQVFRLGAAYEAVKNLSLSADLEYQMWNRFEALNISFIDDSGAIEVQKNRRNSTNSWVVHVGAEYKVLDNVAIRAGYAFDQHSLPEGTVNAAPPDSDKHLAVLGVSYYYGPFGVHAHFSNAFFTPRTSLRSPTPARWSGGWAGGTMAYVTGLSFTAKLDTGTQSHFSKAEAAAAAAVDAPAATVE